MVHLNKGKSSIPGDGANQPISELDRKKLEWLMPYDMWLYNYALEILNAKWNFYQNAVYQQPVRPPYPRYRYEMTYYLTVKF